MAGDLSRIRTLNQSLGELQKSYTKLSSGKRINSAADDAAGLAIAESLAASVKITDQGRRNISDATSALQIADEALDQISQIGTRLSELAAQSANGSLSDSQRTSLDNEFNQLTQEAQRIASTTSFNGNNLLAGNSQSIQVGSDSQAASQIALSGVRGTELASSLSSLNVRSADSARQALDQVNSFISGVATERGSLGSVGARLEVSSNNAATKAETERAAESRIRDADIAETTSQLTAAKIRTDINSSLSSHGTGLTRDVVLRLLS